MAKAKAKAPTKAAESRAARARPHQRTDPERWNRLLILGGVGAVILIVIGIIGYGYWSEEIKPLGKTIARVDGTEISLAHLKRRVEDSVRENSFLLQPESAQILVALPQQTAVQLQREAKLFVAADDLGVSVTDDEMEARLLQSADLPEGSDPKAISEAIARQVDESALHQDEFFWRVKAQILEEKVQAYFTAKAPVAEEQVKPRWIVVADEETANSTLQRLNSGESFATAAADVSTDTETKDKGGAVEWRIRGGFDDVGAAIEDFLFGADLNQRSGVLQGLGGFYIVELANKSPARALTETQKAQYGSRELGDWYDDLDVTHRVELNLTDEDIRLVLKPWLRIG